jgi:16S rRNA processing protein RimM
MIRTTARPWKPLQGDYALIGKVIKVHGVRGEIRIFPLSRCPENFENYKELALVGADEEIVCFHRIERIRSRGDIAITQLEGINSREEATALIGSQVWVSRADFPQLDQDEYYWFDLQGMQVVTEDGLEIGVVISLFNTKAHDVLVVAGKGREYLIPVNGKVIVGRDDSERILVIAPPPGLLDMNE